MPLYDLDKGDKVDIHITLYASERDILDALCARFNCSRAAVLGNLLVDNATIDLTGRVPEPVKPGVRPRRA